MTTFRTATRSVAALGLALGTSLALAHSGHGHDEFDDLQGLLHALSEPDHLAMLLVGLALTAWLAPRVLRLLNRGVAALQARFGAVVRDAKAAGDDHLG